MPGSLPGTGLTALVLGASSLARRRIIPALTGIGATVDVASRRGMAEAAAVATGAAFAEYRDALDRSAASLVYVSTRNHEHVEWADAALRSGRHVVVDKPATLSVEDTGHLLELAASRGRVLAEATVYGWHPQFGVLREIIERHGPVTRLVATFSFPPLPAGNFRHLAACGGGAMWDLGPYAVTPGRLLFGADPLDVVTRVSSPGGAEVEPAFSVILTYPGDRVLVGHFGATTAYVNRLDAIGPTMFVTLDRAFTTPADGACRIRGQAGPERVDVEAGPADAFALFLRDVLAAVASGEAGPFAEAMLRDARALAQLRASSRP